MVFGWANKSNFLTAPEKAWHKHWRGVKLLGKYFVWLDKNADGKYQIDEVELFDKPFSTGSYWRQFSIADDLTLFSTTGRWKHRGIGPRGIPKFDVADFKRWPESMGKDKKKKNVRYLGMTDAGSRACPWPTGPGETMIDRKGRLAFVHSPYLINPDFTTYGGVPDTSGGGDGYKPEVMGLKIHHSLGYSGKGTADGSVKEIFAITGNLGRMTFVAGEERLVIGQTFTGKDGDITDMAPETWY